MRCARSVICERLLIAAVALTAGACDRVPPVVQPMEFNHKRHHEAEVDCATCHDQAADGPAATLPPLRVCAKCHKEIQGKDPAPEKAIMEAVLAKKEVPWVQVNRMDGHVYFSHRAHVGFAEMKCEECHGQMEKVEKALVSSNTDHLTMEKCVRCHEKKAATIDCIACHH